MPESMDRKQVDSEYQQEKVEVRKSKNTSIVLKFIFGVIALAVIKSVFPGVISEPPRKTSIIISDVVQETVDAAKMAMNFPVKVDEFTSLINITAEGDTVRYHYILKGVDTDLVTEESMAEEILSEVCSSAGRLKLLNLGIKFEFKYIIDDLSDDYLILINKSNC